MALCSQSQFWPLGYIGLMNFSTVACILLGTYVSRSCNVSCNGVCGKGRQYSAFTVFPGME